MEAVLPDWPVLCAAIAIVAIGTAVQASIGFGAAMIAAPLLLLLDPAFVPGPMIVTLLVLSLRVAWKDRHAIDYTTLKPAIAGRLLGTIPAALLLGSVSTVTFDLIFSVLVLLAVGLSFVRSQVRPTGSTVFLATLASGFMGTLSSIGGPPLALIYQNARGAELRANLSVLFIIGTTISIAALLLIGRFGWREILLTLPMLVAVAIGLQSSGPLLRYLDQRSARPWLLALCALSALAVLSRALFTLGS